MRRGLAPAKFVVMRRLLACSVLAAALSQGGCATVKPSGVADEPRTIEVAPPKETVVSAPSVVPTAKEKRSSGLITRAELEKKGWKHALLNRWQRTVDGKKEEAVPLYEGKMVQMYDHRAADVVVNTANLHRAAQQESIPDGVKQAFDRLPASQYWVNTAALKPGDDRWVVAFKDVTAPTNMRTMIASILPTHCVGNTLPLLVSDDTAYTASSACVLLANLASLALDFVARQKVQGQHLNWFIVEQLPMIAPERFDEPLTSLRDGVSSGDTPRRRFRRVA